LPNEGNRSGETITQVAGFEAYRQAVDQELRDLFAPRQSFLYDLLRYHLGWTDEQGQPQDRALELHLPAILALTACEALSGEYTPALPAAAAVELVYNFTLVHGEVQAGRIDSQERPSIWWVWGPAQAINAGDGLHALGRSAMMRLLEIGVAPDRVLSAVETLDRACLTMCEGQFLDLTFRDQLMVSSADYYEMVQQKTGALTACAAFVGALAGGATVDALENFSQFGARLGMAWQLSQDINDLWGRHGDGVTPGNLINKKKSLPLIYALEKAAPAEKRELGAIYTKRALEPEDVGRVIAILDNAGARDFAGAAARELGAESMTALDDAGLSPEGRQRMEQLVQLVLSGQV
jgi:geranylgeranyl diphosphate synthase type I